MRMTGQQLIFAGLLALASVNGGLAWGRSASSVCLDAAWIASQETGVPLAILHAISRAESGRKTAAGHVAWPWTVNEAGRGSFFDSKDLAVLHVRAARESGASNIDIGCFQINLHWHGSAFDSIEAMFDPRQNALYAARFLRRLHAETGSWERAIGAFHSRRATAAGPYLERVTAYLDGPGPEPDVPPRPPERHNAPHNGFPLLVPGTGGRLGSLVSAREVKLPPLLK